MSALTDTATNRMPLEAQDFDDVRVGMVSSADVAPSADVPGPQLLAVIAGAPPVRDGVLTGARWEQGERQGSAGVRVEGIVTRWKPARRRGRGTLHQDVRLLDADGQVVEQAQVSWDVPAGTGVRAEESAARVAWDVGTVAWGKHLATGLAANAAFVSTVQTFDGSIAVRAGEEQVELRIYRGSVIEVARKSLEGPTFTVAGSERAWIDLLCASKNDFVSRTQRNHFRSSGNNYQYLRMFKAVMLMIDEAQAAVAAEEAPSA